MIWEMIKGLSLLRWSFYVCVFMLGIWALMMPGHKRNVRPLVKRLTKLYFESDGAYLELLDSSSILQSVT